MACQGCGKENYPGEEGKKGGKEIEWKENRQRVKGESWENEIEDDKARRNDKEIGTKEGRRIERNSGGSSVGQNKLVQLIRG